MSKEIYHGPFRLTWLHTTICKVCQTENVECSFLNIYPLVGWYYCNNCTSHVKNQALTNMDIEIPLIGSLPISNINDKYKVIFERSDKRLWTGYIDPFNYVLKYSNQFNNYSIRVIFDNNDSELNSNNNGSFKDIPLNLIYKYNSNIYEKIINCTNLFNNEKIKIEYKDLSENVQNKIRY